jgi:hypothetical protein
VDDPDIIVHMQMRVGVDHSLDKEAVVTHDSLHSPTTREEPIQKIKAPQKAEVKADVASLAQSGIEVVKPDVAPVAQPGIEVVARAVSPVVENLADPAVTLSVMLQTLVILGIIAFVIAVWKVVDTVQKARTAKSVEADPSTRLQQLLRALRFVEPDGGDEIKLLPIDPQKIANFQGGAHAHEGEKQANEDSGNDTEEEPEAEEMVDDQIIKEVVEVATEAVADP